MRRSRRAWPERLWFTAAYRCENCKLRFRISFLAKWRERRFASCPKCGGFELTILSKRDRVDAFDRNPLRLAQGMLGATLYYCWLCRFQFYDIRSRKPTGPEIVRRAAP